MKITFWGVRGSIPCPGRNTYRYGGNTPCIDLSFEDMDRSLIIDAGSGIRELGNHIMSHDFPKGPLNIEIFLTHTHWDHILGLPFFVPLYVPGTRVRIYGPASFEGNSLQEIVGSQFSYHYFPIRYAELAAEIDYVELKEGVCDLRDGLIVHTKFLNHPVLCLGYRFERKGFVFCTLYDTEPFRNVFIDDPAKPDYNEDMHHEGELIALEENRRLEEFIDRADIVIYDGQYTLKEYESGKIGWGHTPCEYAIAAAARAGVKRLCLFHHDPLRTDNELDQLSDVLCQPHLAGGMDVSFAREGTSINIAYD
jgi:phosphoribosyl 1,2-cyclic phosphodiesterase